MHNQNLKRKMEIWVTSKSLQNNWDYLEGKKQIIELQEIIDIETQWINLQIRHNRISELKDECKEITHNAAKGGSHKNYYKED